MLVPLAARSSSHSGDSVAFVVEKNKYRLQNGCKYNGEVVFKCVLLSADVSDASFKTANTLGE